jgi:hypothetical protein
VSTSDLAAALPKIPLSARGWPYVWQFWHRSVKLVLPIGLSSPWWNAYVFENGFCDHIGKKTSRTDNSWYFYAHCHILYRCEASLPMPWRQSGDSLPCDSSPATLQPIIVGQGKTHGYWSVIGICPLLSIPLAFGFVYLLPTILLQYSFGS